jgi:hypothetical protein
MNQIELMPRGRTRLAHASCLFVVNKNAMTPMKGTSTKIATQTALAVEFISMLRNLISA